MTFLGELKAHQNLIFVGDFSFKIITEVQKTKIQGFFAHLFINSDKKQIETWLKDIILAAQQPMQNQLN